MALQQELDRAGGRDPSTEPEARVGGGAKLSFPDFLWGCHLVPVPTMFLRLVSV